MLQTTRKLKKNADRIAEMISGALLKIAMIYFKIIEAIASKIKTMRLTIVKILRAMIGLIV